MVVIFIVTILAFRAQRTKDNAQGRACGRVPGRMHSRLFWRILGELKGRWSDLQRRA